LLEPCTKLVVLDRDGVINEDSPEYVKSVAEWRPIPGSLEAIAALSTAGFRVVVVTNQAGVARGLFDERTLAAIHERMLSAARSAGGDIAGIYYCPHHPTAGCDCRKPRPGLLRQVERDFNCTLRGAPFIGDKTSDLDAAAAVGARPILVRTGMGAATERERSGERVETFDDLRAAATALLAERG
jgi:D-glycero-D-manno-heptose 1,7-bisphosphate phosphatase